MYNLSRARGWLTMLGVVAVAFAVSPVAANAQAMNAPPVDFGTPPSGEVPIIFNDHHVYTKPDKLKQNRVLAALIRKNQILVPLRSMFEQMGATVSYDAASKTVDVSKPGADVKVTVGKPVVTLNGEDRPLDVPPEIYRGAVVVPVRVISEGMGGYVQWVPDKRLVVVRYLEAPQATPAPTAPPTAPPTPRPTAPPTVAPTAPPTPTPKKSPLDAFVAGDYDFSPLVYNEISPGNKATAYQAKAGFEFPLGGLTLAVLGDYKHLSYDHDSDFGNANCAPGALGCSTVNGSDPQYQSGLCPSTDPGCVTVVGFQNTEAYNGLGQAYVPGFRAQEDLGTVRLGIKVVDPKIYIGVSDLFKHYDYLGYPTLNGFGFGAEKLPEFNNAFSLYGNVYYYPSVSGNYTYPTSTYLGPLSGSVVQLSYNVLKYEIGANVNLGSTPLYIDLGFGGDRFNAKNNAPSDTQESSAFVGLGLHF